MKTLVIFLVLVFIAGVITAKKPGIRLRLTDKGLAYAAKIAKQILDEKIKSLNIKDINGRAHTPIGHISYSLSSMKVKSFSIPTLTLKTKPTVGMEFSVSGLNIEIEGNWHYRKDHWPHVSDSGSFNVKADGVSFDASIKLGADSQGHPTIAPAGCSSSIGGVHVHFSGGASWLYNLFASKVENSIKKTLQSQMCKAANSAITDQGAKAFARFPVKKKLDKYAFIDYGLVGSPNSTISFLDILLKGEFESVSHPSEPPFPPLPLPVDPRSTSMVYGWITDYTFNTAGYVYMQSGFLNHTFTPKEFPKNSSYSLNTKTFKEYIKELYDKFPNLPMRLKAYPTKIPTVSSETTGINLLAECNIEFLVDLANSSSVNAFTLGLTINATVKLDVKNTNLTVETTFFRVKAHLVHSAIGNITSDITKLQFFLDFFVNGKIMDKINARGKVGFPLPLNNGVKLVNPHISSGKSFTLVSADVSYTPSEDEENEHVQVFGARKIRIV